MAVSGHGEPDPKEGVFSPFRTRGAKGSTRRFPRYQLSHFQASTSIPRIEKGVGVIDVFQFRLSLLEPDSGKKAPPIKPSSPPRAALARCYPSREGGGAKMTVSKRFWTICLVASAMVGLFSSGAQALQPGTNPATKYSSCKKLWKQYPNGVAENRSVAREAMESGFRRPAINKAVYMANFRRLDRDYRGVVCGRLTNAKVDELIDAINDGLQDFICEKKLVSLRPGEELPPECRDRR